MKVEENTSFHGHYHHSVTEVCMTSAVYETTSQYQRFFHHKDSSFLQVVFSVLVIS